VSPCLPTWSSARRIARRTSRSPESKDLSGVAHGATRADERIDLLTVLVLDFAEPCVGSIDGPLPADGSLIYAALDLRDAHDSGLHSRLSFPRPRDGCDPDPSGHGSRPFLCYYYLFND
jgi:hypothetical protein